MSSDADKMQPCVQAHQAADDADARDLMPLTLQQRGRLVMAAC